MELKSHRFIKYFGSPQADLICQLAIIENFAEQKVIFEEGEIPDFLYLVLAGQVEFSKRVGLEQYQTVALAGPNDFFGEFGVLDGQPRSTRASASQETILAKIPRDKLMEILQLTNGSVVVQLFRHIIQHLRLTTDQYVNQIVYKEKMVSVGEMVNTIIHDFKSPFTSITLASSMLKEIHADEETAEWCDLIQAQVNRMLGMAEDLLAFTKGNSHLYKQPVNLALLLEQFKKLNAIYFKDTKIEFALQVDDQLWVNGDESKLMRVLQNLVGNAVECFGNRGGRIDIKIWKEQEWVEITIADNGPGIPEAIRDHLFESFVTYGKRGGTGLGTAIAKSIIDAHSGQISFQSQLGEGTTFHIRLPILTIN